MTVEVVVSGSTEHAALIRRLGVRHHCPACGAGDHGRPVRPGGYVSVSHAGPLHVVAIADGPIGVDLERQGAGVGIDQVALHPDELALLAGAPAQVRSEEILATWVAKEAALKLTGTGLRVAPESFVVRHADGWHVGAGVLEKRPVAIGWVDIAGHVSALASFEPVARVVVRTGDGSGDP